jgi:hypothetical protein
MLLQNVPNGLLLSYRFQVGLPVPWEAAVRKAAPAIPAMGSAIQLGYICNSSWRRCNHRSTI